MKRIALALVVSFVAACGGDGGSSPTTPTPTTATTRIIEISGDLSFGELLVGQTADRNFGIRNTGTGTLTVSALNGPTGFTASWTSGQIGPGGSQDVRVRFTPTEVKSYSGTLTVTGDHTSGQNTIPINAQGGRVTPTPPTAPPAPATADVEYLVTGRRASLVTLANASGDTAQFSHVEVPWSFKFSGPRSGQFLYVSAQNDFNSGCIRVQILRRGVQFRNTESCGAYVIATASGSY